MPQIKLGAALGSEYPGKKEAFEPGGLLESYAAMATDDERKSTQENDEGPAVTEVDPKVVSLWFSETFHRRWRRCRPCVEGAGEHRRSGRGPAFPQRFLRWNRQ